jgi:SOS response regulatory protein OraA/RecX
VDELAAAWSVIEGKLRRWETLTQDELAQKIGGLLARRGFSFEVARQITRRAWDELHATDAT